MDLLRLRRSGFYTGALLALLGASGSAPERAAAAPGRSMSPELSVLEPIETEILIEEWRRGPAATATAVVTDTLLAERIHQLRTDSPTFQQAWDDLTSSGIPLVIGSSDQLTSVMPRNIRESEYWAGITLTWPNGRGSDLHRAAVVIRVDWLRDLHAEYGTPQDAFINALDDLIIHEVYGHLAPVVAARSLSGHCPDPVGRERLADSCVGKREAALRRERPAILAATR